MAVANINFTIANAGLGKLINLLNASEVMAIDTIKLGDGGTPGGTPLASLTDINNSVALPPEASVSVNKTAFNELNIFAEVDMSTLATNLNEIGFFFNDGTLFAIGYTIATALPQGNFIQEFNFKFKIQEGLLGSIDFSDPSGLGARIDNIEEIIDNITPNKVLSYNVATKRFLEASSSQYLPGSTSDIGAVKLATDTERKGDEASNGSKVLTLDYLDRGLPSEKIYDFFELLTFTSNIVTGIFGDTISANLSWTYNNNGRKGTINDGAGNNSNINSVALNQGQIDAATISKTNINTTTTFTITIYQSDNVNKAINSNKSIKSLTIQFYYFKDEKVTLQPTENLVEISPSAPSSQPYFHLGEKVEVSLKLHGIEEYLEYEHSISGANLVNKFDVGKVVGEVYTPIDITSLNGDTAVTHIRILDQDLVNVNNTGIELTVSERV